MPTIIGPQPAPVVMRGRQHGHAPSAFPFRVAALRVSSHARSRAAVAAPRVHLAIAELPDRTRAHPCTSVLDTRQETPVLDTTQPAAPSIVDRSTWESARAALLADEKALTHAQDRLNASRRRLPMTPVSSDYAFSDPRGTVTFAELFDGRPQLIVYHNMLAADDDHVCLGCSLFSDGIGNLAHLRARDITFAMVSAARVTEIEAVKTRLGWSFPWYSSHGTTFHHDFVTARGAKFGLSVFLRRGEDIFQTYFTTGRGVEYASTFRALADLTPYGRGEDWEDSPPGWPQVPTHSWERLNDQYGHG
jgi:predicted dithiol-disulfide oxidoreductase (DUF899 family)